MSPASRSGYGRSRKAPGLGFWPVRPLARRILVRQLARCGSRTSFDPITSTFGGISNIALGDDVFLGPRAFISVPHAYA